jgi:hypothetical protein
MKHKYSIGQTVRLINNKHLDHLMIGLTGKIVDLTEDDGTSTYHVQWTDACDEILYVYPSEIESC